MTAESELLADAIKKMLAPLIEATDVQAEVTGIVIGLMIENGALTQQQLVERIEQKCAGKPEARRVLLAMIQAAAAPRQ